MLTWRLLTAADAAPLAQLRAAAEAVDRTGDHMSEQDVRDELVEGRTLGAFAADGSVLAFARVHGPAEVRDVDRIYADGAVLPAARGRGLGRRLLAWAQDSATQLHGERHPDSPGALCVDVHEGNPSKEALVRAAGFQAVRTEHRMTHPLGDALPPLAPVPPGLTLTRYAHDRDEAVRQAHGEAFADHWGATPPDRRQWSHSYTGMRAFRPDLSLLALDGGEIAAYLLTYFWEADAAASGVRDAFVGQLGVRAPWRRRGLGGLLLASALHVYATAGYERAVLGVDAANTTGAPGLYQRAGFVVAGTSTTWAKPLAG